MYYSEFSINDIRVQFINQWKKTRSGFTHVSTFMVPFYGIEKTVNVYYINRTWERYTFQTSMLSAVRSVMNTIRETVTRREKYSNNWKRLNAERRDAIDAAINAITGYTFCLDVMKYLENNTVQ